MIHVQPVSGEQKRLSAPTVASGTAWSVGDRPVLADAKTDFLNALQRAWNDYTFCKKNA